MLGRKKSPDHRALDLSEKSSHSAASIALAPDSHCCQLRCVRCTKAEASAVESPADSRACRISEGVGAVISAIGGRVEKRFHVCLVESLRQFATVRTFNFPSMVHAADTAFNTAHVIADALCLCWRENDSAVRINLGANGYFARVMESAADGDFLGGGHDLLRLIGLRCATHDFNIANAVRLCKSYFASNQNNFVRAA